MAGRTILKSQSATAELERKSKALAPALGTPRNTRAPENIGDEILLQLRTLLLGDAPQKSEDQYSMLVDKLEMHATKNTDRMQSLETRLGSVTASASELRNDYAALDETFSRFIAVAAKERNELKSAFAHAISDLEAEMEQKIEGLTKSVWTKMKQSAATSDRAFAELANEAEALKREIVEHSRHAHASADAMLEQRIAQWRAEIEDDRENDMQKVAAAILDLGNLITPGRRGSR